MVGKIIEFLELFSNFELSLFVLEITLFICILDKLLKINKYFV
jgi:hypothetical protein